MRKTGDRVYSLWTHDKTGEQQRRYGTVTHDEIEFWDYIDVRFDDMPGLDQAVLGYYLFDDSPKWEGEAAPDDRTP